jgi:hypothetical protein
MECLWRMGFSCMGCDIIITDVQTRCYGSVWVSGEVISGHEDSATGAAQA